MKRQARLTSWSAGGHQSILRVLYTVILNLKSIIKNNNFEKLLQKTTLQLSDAIYRKNIFFFLSFREEIAYDCERSDQFCIYVLLSR